MERETLYYVNFPENSEVEGRVFLKDEDYPVLEKDDSYVILCAENGDFCFSNELMRQAITEWNLKVKEA